MALHIFSMEFIDLELEKAWLGGFNTLGDEVVDLMTDPEAWRPFPLNSYPSNGRKDNGLLSSE